MTYKSHWWSWCLFFVIRETIDASCTERNGDFVFCKKMKLKGWIPGRKRKWVSKRPEIWTSVNICILCTIERKTCYWYLISRHIFVQLWQILTVTFWSLPILLTTIRAVSFGFLTNVWICPAIPTSLITVTSIRSVNTTWNWQR